MNLDFDKIKFRHFTPVQIRFNDLDMMGHVNNSIHLAYYDIARVAYFQQIIKSIDWNKESLVIVSITIDFVNPVLLNDQIVIKSKIYQIGNKSVFMYQEITDLNTKEVKSRNRTVLACFDHQKKTTFQIHDSWVKAIKKQEGRVALKKSVSQI